MGSSAMIELGFKHLTEDNWLEYDHFNSYKVRVSLVDGHTEPINHDERRHQVLNIGLQEAVPIEIRRMFEVARGALIYGYFFYPLYALGAEQLFRVAEAAMTFKIKQLGAKTERMRFEKKIEYLVLNQVISAQKAEAWHDIRQLRNAASHLNIQSLFDSGDAIFILRFIADKVNSLFNTTRYQPHS